MREHAEECREILRGQFPFASPRRACSAWTMPLRPARVGQRGITEDLRDSEPLWDTVDILPTSDLALRRKEVVRRFLTRVCELCETRAAAVTIHPVRTLAELPEARPWADLMRKPYRKTLMICDSCHAMIHAVH